MKGRIGSLPCGAVVSIVSVLACALAATNASAQTIQDVHVFQAAGAPGTEASLLVEIRGKDFPEKTKLRGFVAPLKGLNKEPEILSALDSLVVLKISGSVDYFPATVGLATVNGAMTTMDLASNLNPNLPRIDDVEVLKLDRQTGSGCIRIIGANFGTNKENIVVSIVPRNPDLPAFQPIEPTSDSKAKSYCRAASHEEQQKPPSISDLQDDMALVDFSFPCTPGYSAPFRIARVILTVKASGADPSASAFHEMRPARDRNLLYRYSILSTGQAKARFGGGIAHNFYVVQLSIVNKGTKKVQVGLASIQAEVEWAAGEVREKKKYFLEGPATVAPVPLSGAVSFFSEHRASSGGRARFFNSLQGMTTVGSAIQTFFGHGFTQGVAIAGGGFRQGAGEIIRDMSNEQLANLTAQSFETTETISGNGGSVEKVVFIQRGEEEIESFDKKSWKVSRLITNIHGFEITGYEVSETPAKTATEQP